VAYLMAPLEYRNFQRNHTRILQNQFIFHRKHTGNEKNSRVPEEA
jgi:hypothetical protein